MSSGNLANTTKTYTVSVWNPNFSELGYQNKSEIRTQKFGFQTHFEKSVWKQNFEFGQSTVDVRKPDLSKIQTHFYAWRFFKNPDFEQIDISITSNVQNLVRSQTELV